jgi:predicted GNAT family acetyltransferase
MPEVTSVADNREARRFEILRGGRIAGFAEYRDLPHGRAFVHTVIHSQQDGLGSTLIQTLLDEARAEKRNVIPLCPFVRRYIRRNPRYADLVADQKRFGIGLPPDSERPTPFCSV